MFLELSLRHQEKHREMNGLIVERVEVDPLPGPAEDSHHVGNKVGGGVGNSDAESDARAHGGFALADHGRDRFAIFRFDFSRSNQIGDQFIDCFPAIGGLEFGDDLLPVFKLSV